MSKRKQRKPTTTADVARVLDDPEAARIYANSIGADPEAVARDVAQMRRRGIDPRKVAKLSVNRSEPPIEYGIRVRVGCVWTENSDEGRDLIPSITVVGPGLDYPGVPERFKVSWHADEAGKKPGTRFIRMVHWDRRDLLFCVYAPDKDQGERFRRNFDRYGGFLLHVVQDVFEAYEAGAPSAEECYWVEADGHVYPYLIQSGVGRDFREHARILSYVPYGLNKPAVETFFLSRLGETKFALPIARRITRVLNHQERLPWRYGPKTYHRACLTIYERIMVQLRQQAEGLDQRRRAGERVDPQNSFAAMWASLRNARMFEVQPFAFRRLRDVVREYVLRATFPEGKLPEDAEERLIEAAVQVPYPERLPFEVSFFNFGDGAPLFDEQQGWLHALYRVDQADALGFAPEVIKRLHHVGIVATATGDAFEVYHDPYESRFIFGPFARAGQWLRAPTCFPWLLAALVEGINSHRIVYEAGKVSFGDVRRFDKLKKKGALPRSVLPPPYYVVYLKDQHVRDTLRGLAGAGKRKQLDWRHDVRGADCARVWRGPLPIPPKVEKKLLRAKYRIFTVDHPDAETLAKLMERGIAPKQPHEWLAIRTWWRRDHVSPANPALPYIPSVRRATKGLLADDHPGGDLGEGGGA